MRTTRAIVGVALVLGLAVAAHADLHSLGSNASRPPIRFQGYRMSDAGKTRLTAFTGTRQLRNSLNTLGRLPLIVGGNFGAGSSNDRGLFFADGKIVSPFNFSTEAGFDSIVCIKNMKVSILNTSDFTNSPVLITSRCDAAVQTYPRMVRRGQNLLPASMQRDPPKKLVVLALKGREIWVLMFPNPVNMYSASHALTLPPFDFDEAVSISLQSEPVVIYYGKPMMGVASPRVTSALIFDD